MMTMMMMMMVVVVELHLLFVHHILSIYNNYNRN